MTGIVAELSIILNSLEIVQLFMVYNEVTVVYLLLFDVKIRHQWL